MEFDWLYDWLSGSVRSLARAATVAFTAGGKAGVPPADEVLLVVWVELDPAPEFPVVFPVVFPVPFPVPFPGPFPLPVPSPLGLGGGCTFESVRVMPLVWIRRHSLLPVYGSM